MSFIIHVTWRGRTTDVCVAVDNPTLAQLGEAIERKLGASFETQKLLVHRFKTHIAPARQRGQLAREAGLSNGGKALLLASSPEDVNDVRTARDLPGLRSFEDELKRAARRHRSVRNDAESQAPRAEFTFNEYVTWQQPGLHPPPAVALKLLHRLASDPGILGVMMAHRYRVGMLSEMPPQGKVGISSVCLLGVNILAGREISLRLRTDDLQGFRKYERIRETLIHELAHMEFSEHDNDFKFLNSQLRRECAEINARYEGGRSLLDSEGLRVSAAAGTGVQGASELDDPALLMDGISAVMASTARFSGKTLRQLAALRSGDGGGADEGSVAVSRAAAAAALATATGQALGGNRDSSDDCESASDDTLQQFERFDAVTERAEAAARRLGSMDEPSAQPHLHMQQPGGRGLEVDECQDDYALRSEMSTRSTRLVGTLSQPAAAAPPTTAQWTETTIGEANIDAMIVDGPKGSHPAGPGLDLLSTSIGQSTPSMAAAAVPSASVADVRVGPGPAPLKEEEVSRHLTSSAVIPAVAATEVRGMEESRPAGPAPEPLPLRVQLVLHPPAELSDGSIDEAMAAAQEKLRQAWTALTKMVVSTTRSSIAVHAFPGASAGNTSYLGFATAVLTAEDVLTALDTVATLLGNAAQFPGDERYRRVRLRNANFHRRVGRLPGGVELLQVAGFVESVGAEDEAVLQLRRNDPGLLWLVLSLVQEAREQVGAQLKVVATAHGSAPATHVP